MYAEIAVGYARSGANAVGQEFEWEPYHVGKPNGDQEAGFELISNGSPNWTGVWIWQGEIESGARVVMGKTTNGVWVCITEECNQ